MEQSKLVMFSWKQIKECGLLSSDRLAELAIGIETAQQEVRTAGGRLIANAKAVVHADGKTYLCLTNNDYAVELMQREILAVILTPAELELLDKECLSNRERIREAARFAEAQKIPADKWTGDVWAGDTHYPSVEDYLDMTEGGDGEEYIWAAKPIQVARTVDVESLLENAIESDGWEEMDTDDFEGVDELVAALEAFKVANKETVSYWPDYSVAILLPKQTEADEG